MGEAAAFAAPECREALVREFLAESYEGLEQLDRGLTDLEREPDQEAALQAVFRTLHTIKGSCGFLGFSRLEALAHAGEDLLERLRGGAVAPSPEVSGALLVLADAVRQMLDSIAADGTEGKGEFHRLMGILRRLPAGRETLAPPPPSDRIQCGRAPEGSVRLEVALLERLGAEVGELAQLRDRLVKSAAEREDPLLLGLARQLDHLTARLQETTLRTRMLPFGSAWSRLAPLVRSLARECGKQVRLELAGEATELDRRTLEAVGEALTHLVRNAVAHGIEDPETRIASGKAAEGRLRLRAARGSGQVVIEVSDDGRGLALDRVRARAVELGLVSSTEAAGLGSRELVPFLFAPGFSTAPGASHISGRGVGLDVVRTVFERIGGSVKLRSAPGRGTLVRIRVPVEG